ncbi:MAG: peptidylprolyl isomerase [Planctomycetota bacterium]
MIRFLLFTASMLVAVSPSHAEDLRPTDPYASINGYPVFVGELNLLLMQKLGARDPMQVNENVRRASASLIVRQHLAMQSLREQGGESLAQLLDRNWSSFSAELKRQGFTVTQYTKRFQSDATSMRAAQDWQTAWKAYLRSRLTDENLKRFYQTSPERYAGARWDVSHLFFAVDRSDPDSKAVALERAEQIRARLEESSSEDQLASEFAEFARTESDGATAEDGGRIGWVSKTGDLPGLVMASIRRTNENGVTKPVVTSRGVHLALVHKKASRDVAFEDLKDRAQLRRDATDRLFTELVSRQKDPKVTWLVAKLRPPG